MDRSFLDLRRLLGSMVPVVGASGFCGSQFEAGVGGCVHGTGSRHRLGIFLC